MRRILVDYTRERHREKRGGSAENLPLDEAFQISSNEKNIDLIALDEALNRLAKLSERQARVVELRYFSGLSNDETAEVLGFPSPRSKTIGTLPEFGFGKKLQNDLINQEITFNQIIR